MNALDAVIDASIQAREENGLPITADLVAKDLVTTVPTALMLAEFQRGVTHRVSLRLQGHTTHEGGETS